MSDLVLTALKCVGVCQRSSPPGRLWVSARKFPEFVGVCQESGEDDVVAAGSESELVGAELGAHDGDAFEHEQWITFDGGTHE